MRKWTRRYPRAIASTTVALALLAVLLPVLYLAIDSLQTNKALQAESDFRSFQEESSEFLSMLMADPSHNRFENVASGIQILEKHNALTRTGIYRFLQCDSGNLRHAPNQFLTRHIAHVAIIELRRLEDHQRANASKQPDLERLDRLINAAKIVDGNADSRVRLFIESERAKLAGDTEKQTALASAAQATEITSDSDRYLEAVRLLDELDPAGAAELLSGLADRGAVPPGLRWTILGRAQMNTGNFEDGILSLTQSIERAPRSSVLHSLRGRCHFELRQDEQAERDYRKAIQLDPDNIRAWSQLGLLCYATKRYQEAIENYDRAMELQPGRIWTLLKRSKAFRAIGKPDLAKADFEAALRATTDEPIELLYRAKALSDTDPLRAIEDLKLAQQLAPDRPYYVHETAWILAVKLGRHKEAVELYNQVLEAQEDNEYALINSALSLVRLGEKTEALRRTKKAMADENQAVNLYQAACVHAMIGTAANGRRAVTLLAKSISQGYMPAKLDHDSDLDSIRDNEDFITVKKFYETSQRNGRIENSGNKNPQNQFGNPIDSTHEIFSTRDEAL